MKLVLTSSHPMIIAAVLLTMLLYLPAQAQIETVPLTDPPFDIAYLPLGTSSYMVYLVDTTTGAVPYNMTMWEREIGLSNNTIEVNWRMNQGDSTQFINKKITIDAQTFKPLTEAIFYSAAVTGDRDFKFFYHFKDSMLTTSKDTMLHNYTQMSIPYQYRAYLWEIDLEIFSMLSYKVGKSYSIPFYHPAGEAPAYYEYEVNRQELVEIGGQNVNAWVLIHDDLNSGSLSEWWIDCKSHQVLKMKSISGKTIRYKYLLAYKKEF